MSHRPSFDEVLRPEFVKVGSLGLICAKHPGTFLERLEDIDIACLTRMNMDGRLRTLHDGEGEWMLAHLFLGPWARLPRLFAMEACFV